MVSLETLKLADGKKAPCIVMHDDAMFFLLQIANIYTSFVSQDRFNEHRYNGHLRFRYNRS